MSGACPVCDTDTYHRWNEVLMSAHHRVYVILEQGKSCCDEVLRTDDATAKCESTRPEHYLSHHRIRVCRDAEAHRG